MTMSKWEKFHSLHSPIVVDQPNMGDANLIGDWHRQGNQDNLSINGISLQQYSAQYNYFKTTKDIRNFWKDVLFKDFEVNDDTDLELMFSYLEKAFHQGGLMYPVSSAFATCSIQNFTVNHDSLENQVNIVTLPTGFKIQEIAYSRSLVALRADLATPENVPYIDPDYGYDFVVKLTGTINIDFSQNNSVPTIGIENCGISYGNKTIKALLDQRSFLQIIIDFLRYYLGLNSVKDISYEYEGRQPQNHDIEIVDTRAFNV